MGRYYAGTHCHPAKIKRDKSTMAERINTDVNLVYQNGFGRYSLFVCQTPQKLSSLASLYQGQ